MAQAQQQVSEAVDRPAWWYERACVAASMIEDPAQKVTAFVNIVTAQAHSGDFNSAKATARYIKKASPKAQAYRQIALAQAIAGDLPGARATAAGINPNSEWKAEALRDIAQAQVKAGDPAGARKLLADRGVDGQAVSDRNFMALTSRNIASEHVKAGDLAAAMTTADALTDPAQRSVAFRDIALAHARAGDTVSALVLVDGITDLPLKTIALAGVAQSQARAGDVPSASKTILRAKATLDAIDNTFFAKLVRREVIAAEAHCGNLLVLSRWIERIDHAGDRVDALLAAAKGLTEALATRR